MQTTGQRRIHPSELYQPRCFRRAPEHRRCAVYMLVGLVLAICVVRLVGAFVRRQPGFHGEAPGEFIVGAFLAVVFVAPALLILRWQIRVDQRGIATRWLWGWDLWPWEAFQDGRIGQGPSIYAYVWPKRPWWKRSLSFALLKEADRDFVRELCLSVWVPPAEPEAPVELTIRQLGKTVRFFSGGICLGAEGWDPDYGWGAVAELRIVRLEHGRRDFRRLEIVLPDRTVKLLVHEGSPNWQGADAESIAGLLRRYVARERTLVVAKHGLPQSMKEADYRLEQAKKQRRENRNAMRWMTVVILGFLLLGVAAALYGHPSELLAPALMLGLVMFLCWQLFRRTDQSLAREQETVTKWRSQQMAGADTP